MGPLLDVKISAGYGDRTTLHDVRFFMDRGDRTGVVGTSGAGKSTLVLALLGMMPWRKGWARGHVLLRGKDLMRCSERELRELRGKEVALVPQSPAAALNPALSLGTHFKELWRAHDSDSKGLQPRMMQLLDRVELPTDPAFLKRKPAEISIGQAQRVMIALALLHRPSLLIADEPTSALDVCTQREVVDLLREISLEEEMTLLYVSHDLITVFQLCENMLVMNSGSLVDRVALSDAGSQDVHPATRRLLQTLPVAPHLLRADVPFHSTLYSSREDALMLL